MDLFIDMQAENPDLSLMAVDLAAGQNDGTNVGDQHTVLYIRQSLAVMETLKKKAKLGKTDNVKAEHVQMLFRQYKAQSAVVAKGLNQDNRGTAHAKDKAKK